MLILSPSFWFSKHSVCILYSFFSKFVSNLGIVILYKSFGSNSAFSYTFQRLSITLLFFSAPITPTATFISDSQPTKKLEFSISLSGFLVIIISVSKYIPPIFFKAYTLATSLTKAHLFASYALFENLVMFTSKFSSFHSIIS